MTGFEREYGEARDMTERWLAERFTGDVPQKRLYEAMRHSLLAGGKRIRPVLALKFAQAAGCPMADALPVACAAELLHTYSLIHDDLPCMDGDVLRRGKPTCHVVFGECTATLAGDALQAAAFEAVLSAPLPPERLARAGLYLAQAAGADGMCGGQELDMEGETERFTLPRVRVLHALKTGALIRGACRMGVAAGGGDGRMLAAADEYGDALGLAFQIRDDMLDLTATPEQMGKSTGADAENGKSTFASLLGLEECARRVRAETQRACAAVEGLPNAPFFQALAETLAGRDH